MTTRACAFNHHDRDGNQTHAETGLLVCWRCSTALRRDLDELETLYTGATADDELIPSGTPDGGGARTVAGPRSPAVDALLVHTDPRSVTGPGESPAALAAIAGWARLIRTDRSVDVPPDQMLRTVPLGRISMTRELETIRFHWDWCMAQTWVLDFAAEIRGIVHALKLVRRLYPVRLRVGRCPVVVDIEDLPEGGSIDLMCGTTLTVRADDTEIRCRGCGTVWPRGRWRELGSPWADYASLATELGVKVGTLYVWASRDRWETTGTRGRRLVRRVDALESYARYRGGLLGEAG